MSDRVCVHKDLVGQARELGFDAAASGLLGKDLSGVATGVEPCFTDLSWRQ